MIAAIDAQSNRGLRAALPTSYATYVERWAIVVGVSKYQDDSINLKYADRDAEALYELLKTPSGGGFAEEHICKLVNEEATTAKITRALRSFLKKPGKDDIVLLYFACHGAPDTDRPDILYLLTHDTDPKDIAGTALPMRELNLSLKENLLAGRVIIIADTCHSAGISNDSTRDIGNNSGAINLYLQEVGAAQKGIALLTSAEANQVSFEDEKWGGGTQMHGFFTYTLVQELRQASEDILQRDLFERVRETVQSRYRQTPLFIGDIDKPLFFTQLNLRNCPEFFTFSQRRCYSAFDDIFLQDLHQKTSKQFTTKFPDFYYSLGLAFLESGNATQALTLLETAVQFSKSNIDEKLFALSLAQLNNQRHKDSSQTFQRYIEAAKVDTSSSLIKELSSAIDHLAKPRALLIGVDTYLDAEKITPIEDAVSDTLALQEALISEFGFQSENVKVLLNQDATYQSILKEFRELVNLAQLSPTFFYFAGKGSIDAQDSPTILAFDSRDKDTPDILLKQLSQIAGQTEVNLTSVIDSSWSASLMSSNSRYVKCDDVSSFSSRAMQYEQHDSINRSNSQIPQIGYISIYPESIKYSNKRSFKQDLTTRLIQFIKKKNSVNSTYKQLFESLNCRVIDNENNKVNNDEGICLIGKKDALKQTVVGNALLESKIRDYFIKIEERPMRDAVFILKCLIEQRNGKAPEELFNLGIAYYSLKEYEESVTVLQKAIDQVSEQNSTTTEKPSLVQQAYPEAHYWLGRVFFESKRDPALAVSELRLATQQSPEYSPAHYYLGKALRALVEQEILSEAERAFQTYLDAGAPLGQQEEVQEFFKSRKEKRNR